MNRYDVNHVYIIKSSNNSLSPMFELAMCLAPLRSTKFHRFWCGGSPPPQARIQDSEGGGGFVHSEGGVSYRNFRSGSKLLQGPGQINKQTKLQTAVGGGGPNTQKNPCIRACPPPLNYLA